MTQTFEIDRSQEQFVRTRSSVVRQAVGNDLPSIVTIHQKAFSNYFLTRLGGAFLRRYYALVLNYRTGIVLVSEQRSVPNGFVCGFVEPAEFYQLMWCKRRAFVLPALSALMRRPWLAPGVLYGVQRVHSSASGSPARSCELASIAVAPEAGGNGVGRALVEAFIAKARSMDAECIYLTTDADGNQTANALYRQAGFRHVQRFLQRKGRWMNEYAINHLQTSGAVRYAHE